MGGIPDSKICASCGRTMTWRKAWERSWPEMKFCSDACRRRKVSKVDTELEVAILSLLSERDVGATICPSEAARLVDGDDWRDLMEPSRRAARRLVSTQMIDITQNGRVVDPSTAKGPIRLRLRPPRAP